MTRVIELLLLLVMLVATCMLVVHLAWMLSPEAAGDWAARYDAARYGDCDCGEELE
jgi:NADH:ubiquinone oxidoreductase subunit 3 (subunit A)